MILHILLPEAIQQSGNMPAQYSVQVKEPAYDLALDDRRSNENLPTQSSL